MKKEIKYSASGTVLGNYWGGHGVPGNWMLKSAQAAVAAASISSKEGGEGVSVARLSSPDLSIGNASAGGPAMITSYGGQSTPNTQTYLKLQRANPTIVMNTAPIAMPMNIVNTNRLFVDKPFRFLRGAAPFPDRSCMFSLRGSRLISLYTTHSISINQRYENEQNGLGTSPHGLIHLSIN